MRSSRLKTDAAMSKKPLRGRTITPESVNNTRLQQQVSSNTNRYHDPREPHSNRHQEAAIGQQELWTSTEDLFWDHMREVQNKWNTLKQNDDIWAKLIYFEQNRRLAKAYVSTPVLTIDGSTNGLDGFRIGLSGIENSYRDLGSIACLRTIGHGIKLEIDQHGNILIKKIAPQLSSQTAATATAQSSSSSSAAAAAAAAASQCSIWVKEWPNYSSSSSLSSSSSPPWNGQGQQHNNDSSLASFSSSSASSSSSSSSSSDYSRLTSFVKQKQKQKQKQQQQQQPQSSSALDHWPMQEITDTDSSYKLFDMQKFRAQLDRQHKLSSKLNTSETLIDWRQCVSIISFVTTIPRQSSSSSSSTPTTTTPIKGSSLDQSNGSRLSASKQEQILTDPCWIMLINIIAIDMLKSSICDNNYNYSQPHNQVSSLVDKYQFEANNRTKRDHNQPLLLQQQLRTSASASSLYPYKKHPDYNRDDNQLLQYQANNRQQQQQQQQLAVAATATSTISSERLKRLNNFNKSRQTHGNSNATSTGNSNNNNNNNFSVNSRFGPAIGGAPINVRSKNVVLNEYNRQLNAANSSYLRGAKLTTNGGSSSNASSSSNNAIYTTFTGKYLDKQQRQLRPRNASSDDLSGGCRQRLGGAGQLATNLYPIDSIMTRGRMPARLNGSSHKVVGLERRAKSPLIESTSKRQLASDIQTGGSGGGGTNLNLFLKKPTQMEPNQLLAHSLSAFDLSHGHKLHLRSLKSSSIKMNFDSGDDDDDDDDNNDHDHDHDHDHDDDADHGEDCQEQQRHLQAVGQKSLPRQTGRWALPSVNNEALEWADLAKKFSLNRQNDDPLSAGQSLLKSNNIDDDNDDDDDDVDDGIPKSSSTISSNRSIEIAETDGGDGGDDDDNKNDATNESNSSKQLQQQQQQQQTPQKKVSRCSLASAGSSSSGCADNDYFVSQSSSSMSSSSIRISDNGGAGGAGDCSDEILTSSQPASSSGIGNTSDDYNSGKQQLQQQQHNGARSGAILNGKQGSQSIKTMDTSANRRGPLKEMQIVTQISDENTRATTRAATNVQCNKQRIVFEDDMALVQGGQAVRPRLTKRQIKSVSLNRSHSAKTVELADHEIDDIYCQHCFSGDQRHLNNGGGGGVDDDDNLVRQELCDCMEHCDNNDRAHDEFNTCDCCYDCLQQQQQQQQQQHYLDNKFVTCNLEGLCDCGAVTNSTIVGPLDYPCTNEEPIYDQLPRLDQLKPRKFKSRAIGVPSKSTSRSDLSASYDNFNDILSIPMPADRDIGGDDKQAPDTRGEPLKRNNGWLERRRYVRLFPKFMFSSSTSSSSSSSPSPAQQSKRGQSKRHNGTMEPVNMARNDQPTTECPRSRSGQNLLSH